MSQAKKRVYNFTEGSKEQKDLLGGKGANLAEMTGIGLPVPKGFTITTEACLEYLDSKKLLPELVKEIEEHIARLENETGKKFADEENPLLVSVRSGSKFSMPGMMDTILNLGLNHQSVEIFAHKTENPVFAYDCYRRLIQMFGDVVKGVDKNIFEEALTLYKATQGYSSDIEMKAEDWKEIIQQFTTIYLKEVGENFPQDPSKQLYAAVEAVFTSWNNPRAVTYRRIHEISDKLGTAVNIQEMVFGNTGGNSGTGVAFTRNPATGEAGVFGEFLLNAQGEDVVAGIRTPRPIQELKQEQPTIYMQFEKICHQLEAHYQDMQDIEFTIEEGKLFILQTRNGKRTAKAAFKIATQMAEDGVISKEESLKRLTPSMITQLLHPVFDEQMLAESKSVAKGLPASPGAASGRVYFHAQDAQKAHAAGQKVILLRTETSPEDIEGMVVSEAIVTSRGGMTSHAAVVARGMGVCCVVGCEQLTINEKLKQAYDGTHTINEGDLLSVDGTTGKIYRGEIKLDKVQDLDLLVKVLQWASHIGNMQVRANAETVEDIRAALDFGASGIGLARTEHMFFGKERILEMRKMFLSEDQLQRKQSLETLKEFQKKDFAEILSLTEGMPCTIRLLDPPLHEFMPKTKEEYEQVAEACGQTVDFIMHRGKDLEEFNPMLGHRGCRLAITYPEIYEMQVEAIMEAALELAKTGKQVKPEIMIPLVAEEKELSYLKKMLEDKIQDVFEKHQLKIAYKIGAMLEIPRACLTADQLATSAQFFSFGTNDLTQLTYGFSRDDSVKFLPDYVEKGILEDDPFQHLDQKGVGSLMKTAIELVKPQHKDISFGVCGEVGGDPDSVAFLQKIGLDYVSCSPYRVPAVLLTVAQMSIK
ncbi:pyruvate, phosphate dikinase [Lactococcus petauri]|uniref:Pyruvate, phosphate dikinase n=1 Tax=Lactococcus petauri TaxID=1940789 RepID=A0A252CES1_9LACT|nr:MULTISPECIES: pyruvate, phosphate dikinase [Lactococcus]MCH1713870.1 pyruvate, phosphate dikinase [Lactococcus petauri]MDT2527274.1 pyruvate, phosphate dikinase [Lactococcus petauri]MDT2541611.1 pyruvate, phosphate dikinase [Lactococcus petauri]MDT2558417.1 pyruvate, phosphate dikinase [Lactococcus petauri]MDT2560319.1 pyruvate, phosphate dikinase [Lactococcus petauri]